MVCLVASLFLASVSQTILAAVMPLIVADLGGFDRYAWAAAAYLVTATVTYPIVGRLSDAYRRKRFLVAGLVTFVAGTMLVGMSQSMNQIIAFRAFQGIGGGMVTTCCYVAITDLFPPEERGKFHGMIGAVHGLSSVAGPILGGIAAERLSWEWPFFLVAMAGGTDHVAGRPDVSGAGPARRSRTDRRGRHADAGACRGFPDAGSVGRRRRRSRRPVLAHRPAGLRHRDGGSLRIRRDPQRVSHHAPGDPCRSHGGGVRGRVAVDQLCLYGSVFYLPAFAQVVLGRSVAGSVALLLPMLLGTVVGGILSGQLLSRAGPRYRLLAMGSGGVMLAGAMLTTTIDTDTSSPLIAIFVCLPPAASAHLRLARARDKMDTDGTRRLDCSSLSCPNGRARRTDFFHEL